MIEAFELTVVAMVVVFLVLTGIMFMMELTHRLISRAVPVKAAPAASSNEAKAAGTPADFGPVDIEKDELAKVAALTALAQASEDHNGRHFMIDHLTKI